jgi:LPXTG-motif cell wall anchor domain protein
MKRNKKGVSPFQKILATMAVVMLLIGIVAWAKNTYFTNNKEAIASDSLTEEELNQAKADLTVDLDAEVLQAAFPNVSRELLYSSMPNQNKDRVAAAGFSTALTFPFSGASQEDGQSYSDETVKGWWESELTEELLRNPVYGVAVARALSESKFSDGSTLLDLNPWLGEFVQKYDAAFQENGNGNGYFLTKETADGPILVTDEYRRYAVGTRWLLDRFVVKGVSRLYAEKHWGLRPANDLQPSRIKAEAFEEPEDRDALIASFLTKSGKNVLIIGFNIHDKRPEIPGSRPKPVPEETPQETTPQETPQETKPEPTKPGRDPEPTTPAPTKPHRDPEPTKPHRDPDPKPTKPDPEPTRPTTPETTPAPTPETKKERSKDSVNNGGGRVGGGSTVIGTDAYEPKDPITETGKGHGDPAKETPATPTQDQSHQDVKVDHVDQNKMNYETIPETQSSWKTDQGQNLITGTQGAAGSGSGNSGNTGNSGNSSAGNSSTATEGTPLTGYGEEFHLED